MLFAVVIEKADGNYSADVPDLPGCAGHREQAEGSGEKIREAVRFRLDGLREDGQPTFLPLRVCATQHGRFQRTERRTTRASLPGRWACQ
jgi:predicted RNase H-like HicB family nuclease